MLPRDNYSELDILVLPAGASLVARRLVVLDANGALVYAASTDKPIGVTLNPAASGELCRVLLWHRAPLPICEAAGTITFGVATDKRGVPVYAAANGQVDATGTIIVGYGQNTASANGPIEVIPNLI